MANTIKNISENYEKMSYWRYTYFDLPKLNPYIENMDEDILYHIALGNKSHDLPKMFGDIKFVVMGSTPKRMEQFAYFVMKEMGHDLPPGTVLNDISRYSHRYAMFKVGPILCVSHGMGTPSISILLNELIKLVYHAQVKDPIFIRLGTSGGFGQLGGTIVITKKVFNECLESSYEMVILGNKIKFPAELNEDLIDDLQTFSRNFGFNTIVGSTYCSNNFYEGSGRCDGAICEYTLEETFNFFKRLQGLGIVNTEMESMAFAALTRRAGIKSAVVTVVLSDRMENSQILQLKETLDEWQLHLFKLVATYMKHHLGLGVSIGTLNNVSGVATRDATVRTPENTSQSCPKVAWSDSGKKSVSPAFNTPDYEDWHSVGQHIVGIPDRTPQRAAEIGPALSRLTLPLQSCAAAANLQPSQFTNPLRQALSVSSSNGGECEAGKKEIKPNASAGCFQTTSASKKEIPVGCFNTCFQKATTLPQCPSTRDSHVATTHHISTTPCSTKSAQSDSQMSTPKGSSHEKPCSLMQSETTPRPMVGLQYDNSSPSRSPSCSRQFRSSSKMDINSATCHGACRKYAGGHTDEFTNSSQTTCSKPCKSTRKTPLASVCSPLQSQAPVYEDTPEYAKYCLKSKKKTPAKMDNLQAMEQVELPSVYQSTCYKACMAKSAKSSTDDITTSSKAPCSSSEKSKCPVPCSSRGQSSPVSWDMSSPSKPPMDVSFSSCLTTRAPAVSPTSRIYSPVKMNTTTRPCGMLSTYDYSSLPHSNQSIKSAFQRGSTSSCRMANTTTRPYSMLDSTNSPPRSPYGTYPTGQTPPVPSPNTSTPSSSNEARIKEKLSEMSDNCPTLTCGSERDKIGDLSHLKSKSGHVTKSCPLRCPRSDGSKNSLSTGKTCSTKDKTTCGIAACDPDKTPAKIAKCSVGSSSMGSCSPNARRTLDILRCDSDKTLPKESTASNPAKTKSSCNIRACDPNSTPAEIAPCSAASSSSAADSCSPNAKRTCNIAGQNSETLSSSSSVLSCKRVTPSCASVSKETQSKTPSSGSTTFAVADAAKCVVPKGTKTMSAASSGSEGKKSCPQSSVVGSDRESMKVHAQCLGSGMSTLDVYSPKTYHEQKDYMSSGQEQVMMTTKTPQCSEQQSSGVFIVGPCCSYHAELIKKSRQERLESVQSELGSCCSKSSESQIEWSTSENSETCPRHPFRQTIILGTPETPEMTYYAQNCSMYGLPMTPSNANTRDIPSPCVLCKKFQENADRFSSGILVDVQPEIVKCPHKLERLKEECQGYD